MERIMHDGFVDAVMERNPVFWRISALWIILTLIICDQVTPFQGGGTGDEIQKFYYDPWPREPGLSSTEDSPADTCSAADCRNGGICLFTQEGKQCSCRSGFTGRYCEDLDLDLNCDNDHMRIQILRSALSDMGVPEDLLHLSSPECKVEVSDLYVSVTLTHVNHTVCGTHLYVNESHLIYSNELRTERLGMRQPIPGELISRTFDVSIRFSCVYHYDRVVSLPYPLLTSASLATFMVKERMVNVTMTLHPTAAFSGLYGEVPIVPLSRRLYVQVQLHGLNLQNQLGLELEECWATPGMNHSDQIRHLIISNGYGNDSTVEMIPTTDYSLTRFSLKMFHFIRYPQFYLHCRICLCQTNATGCEKLNLERRRQQRDLHDPYRKVISCGPIRLIGSVVSSVGNPESGPNPLVLPGSLAAGAMVLLFCLVAVTKALKRRGVLGRLGAPTA